MVAGSLSCEDTGPGGYLSALSDREVEDGLAPDGILPEPGEGLGVPFEQQVMLAAGYFPHEVERVIFDPKGKEKPVVVAKKKAAPEPEQVPIEISLREEPSSVQPASPQALPVKKAEVLAHRSEEATADWASPELGSVRNGRESSISLGPTSFAVPQTTVRDEKIEAPLASPLGASAVGVPSVGVSGPVLDRAASAAPSIDHALVEGPVFLVDRGAANLVSHSQPSPDDRDAGGVEAVFFARRQSGEPVLPNLLSSLALAGERTEGDRRAGLTDSGGEGGVLSPRPVIGSAPEPEGRSDSGRSSQVRGEGRAAEGALADRPADPLSAVSNLFSFPSLDGREPWSAPLSPTSTSVLNIAALLREYGPTAALTGNTSAVTQSIAGTQGAAAAARSLYTPYAAPSGARAPAGAGTVLAEAVNGTTSGSSLGDGAAGGQSQGNMGGGSDRDSRDPDRAPVLPA